MRIALPISQVVRVKEPESPLPAAPLTDADTKAAAPKIWRFIKNHHPHETLTFKDQTTFKFPGQVFETADEKLASKILEVAEIYRVVLKG